MSDNIYKRAANYVTGMFEKYPHPNLLFHNIEHTRKVVERAEEIAAHYTLSEADTLVVYIAAWFHDVGHLLTGIEKHEEKSVEVMKEFMGLEQGIGDDIVNRISNCILATHLPSNPKNLTEEIVCDADTYHFGTKEFKTTNKLVKREFALRGYSNITQDWIDNTINLLTAHTFYTSYCKILLEFRKKKNIEWLRKKNREALADNTHHNIFDSGGSEVKTAKQKGNLLARGIQTIMRLTSANHLKLSEMADRKANILISVNAIMMSVILSILAGKLPDYPYLTIPVVMFLTSSLITVIVAILATLPKVTTGTFSREDVLSKKTNLLFFGNYYKSTLEEYQWAMATLMKDAEYLYSVLVTDIHQIGIVLGKKYKMINLAYNIFMIGLSTSVIAFFIAVLINHSMGASHTPTITNASGNPL